MSAKIVCADCHFVFDPAERDGRTACPQCGAAVHSFGPTIQPADPTPDDSPRRARPVARRVPKDDPDERPVRRSRRRENEDDDDFEDRPRRRRPPASSPGSSVWTVVGIGAFFLLALGGLGFAAWSRLAGPDAGPAPIAMQPPPAVPNELPVAVPAPPPKPLQDLQKKADGGFAEQMREPMRQPPMLKGPLPVPPPPVFDPPPIGPAPAPKLPAVPLKFPAVNPLPIAAEHDVKERRTLSLPGEVAAVCIGGGGRFVCLHFEKLRQIGIFDANTAKVAKYLPVAGESVALAAGMDRLMVYDRNADVFVRWNLRTFAKEATLPNPTGKPVGRLLMGSASAGPLVLAPKTDPNGWGGGETAFVDPVSFKLFDVANPFKNTGRAPNWNAAAISDDGKLIVGPTGWGSGEFLFFRPGNPPDAKTVPGINAATARPSSDGRYVYSAAATHTATGAPVNAGIAANPAAVAVPSIQGNLVFRAFNRNDGANGGFPFRDRDADADLDFKFYMEGQSTPFVTWPKQLAPLAANQYRPPGTAVVDQRFFLVPDAKLLAILSSSNDRLFLHRFDADEELEKSGVDYLFVASRPPAALFGKPFAYPIRVKSRKGGVKYKLESGPDGMTVAADGKLTWAVPRDAESASVLLTITDASGQEIFHNFTVEPVKDEPVAIAVATPPDVAVTVRPPAVPNPVPAVPSIFEVSSKVFPLTPTKAEDGAEVKLPGEVDAACMAGGGRFVALRIPTAKQLAILDLCEAKVAKYLPLAEEKALFAAGMNKLFVLNPSANVIQRFNLTTFEKELTVANPVEGGTAQTLAMGHASEGPLLVVTGDGARGWNGKHAFLNAKTLRPIDSKAAAIVGHGASVRFTEGPVRTSPDGRVYGFWRTNTSPSGLDCLVLADDGSSAVYHEHTSVGAILPGPDGTLHTGSGLFTPKLKPLDRAATPARTLGTYLIPSAHGSFYLELDLGRRFLGGVPRTRPGAKGATGDAKDASDIAIKAIGDTAPLIRIDKLAGYIPAKDLPDLYNRAGALPLYDRFYLVPGANVLAVLDGAKTAVAFNRLNLKEKLAASGTDYLLAFGKPPAAARGTKFAYVPEVWSKAGGVKFKLDAGPDGMTADAKGVTWDVPKDYPGGTLDVILTVSNDAGKETFHTFKVSVADGK